MKERCSDPNATQWKWYGGKGIKVCERWHRFENFYADMGLRPSLHYSIDRIENEKGYEPGNCRWATKQEQIDNQKKTIHVVVENEKMTLRKAVSRTGLSYSAVYGRLRRGHNIQTALYENDLRLKGRDKFEAIKRLAIQNPILQGADLARFNEVVIDVAVLAGAIQRTAIPGVYFSLIHDPRG